MPCDIIKVFKVFSMFLLYLLLDNKEHYKHCVVYICIKTMLTAEKKYCKNKKILISKN